MSVGGIIVAYMLLLGCASVCVLKGRRGFTVIGVVVPVAWVLGAVASAKPQSLWAWTFDTPVSPPGAQR
jgi:hypothetical protein